ncbi:MAG: short-chain dehydrogenase/reductase sdr [Crocinitomicaceae bacterium]|jgi:short-subunit dehydrogenase|nr:short-chain dehydrogenase/reductase sdr [Crocinitomicaceae bacterium]
MTTGKTALITGASGGIGYELALIHAKAGDNLVLVARSEDKLNELKNHLEKQYGIDVHVLPLDLSEISSPEKVYAFTQEKGIFVDYLVNNAGFGDFGFFHEADWDKTNAMIQLNITILTHLTHVYIRDMIKAKKGKIMNVASTAAFQPGPTMAVYYATKAYVLHFSEAIGNEVKPYGITVTALCPGATESGFQAAAAMENSKLVKGKKLPASQEVAAYGHKAMMNGKAVAVHGFMNYLMANAARFFPRSWTVKVVRKIQDAR